jgi:hypothetical protein
MTPNDRTPDDMTPPDMSLEERVVASRLHTLADIPVTERDVEHAHDKFRARLRAAPTGATRGTPTRLLAAAAAVVLVAAGAVWVSSRHHPDTVGPTHKLSRAERVAIHTATSFVDAIHFYNLPQARRLLAPGATFAGALSAKGWPETMRFFQDTGGQIDPGTCRLSNRVGQPGIMVDCPYSYQLMRSADLGLGPYTGSHFRISTRRARVIRVYMWHRTDTNGWSRQMWTPFATWIDTFHHQDGPRMYPDWPKQGHFPDTNQAIQLWAHRTRQFVHYLRHICPTTHQSVFTAACSGQRQGG